jgi:glycosyltransferase involved in cell wall biosynthesis
MPDRDGKFTVVAVSRLERIKNLTTTIKAFGTDHVSSSKLIVVGDGSLKADLLAEIHEMGLDQYVQITGWVDREEVYKILSNADLFISASRGEGLPISVLEAMACGCPVVLSDISPHREIASDADFIPLIPFDQVTGFAEAIQQFKRMSTHTRQAIGQRCRNLVEKKFSAENMNAEYENVYWQLVEENARLRALP